MQILHVGTGDFIPQISSYHQYLFASLWSGQLLNSQTATGNSVVSSAGAQHNADAGCLCVKKTWLSRPCVSFAHFSKPVISGPSDCIIRKPSFYETVLKSQYWTTLDWRKPLRPHRSASDIGTLTAQWQVLQVGPSKNHFVPRNNGTIIRSLRQGTTRVSPICWVMAQHFPGDLKKRKRQNWLRRVVQYLGSPHMTENWTFGMTAKTTSNYKNWVRKKKRLSSGAALLSGRRAQQTIGPGSVFSGGRGLTWEAVITGRVRVAACRLHVRLSLCGQHALWGATPDWGPALWRPCHPSLPSSPPTSASIYAPGVAHLR